MKKIDLLVRSLCLCGIAVFGAMLGAAFAYDQPAKPKPQQMNVVTSVCTDAAEMKEIHTDLDALIVKLAEMDGKLGPQAFDDTRSIISRLDQIAAAVSH